MSSGCFAAIAFGLLLMVFGLLHLGFRKWEDLSVIIKIGLPSFFRQDLASIATAMLNINFAVCGDVAAARHRADAAAADVLNFIICFPFLIQFFQALNQKIAEQKGA